EDAGHDRVGPLDGSGTGVTDEAEIGLEPAGGGPGGGRPGRAQRQTGGDKAHGIFIAGEADLRLGEGGAQVRGQSVEAKRDGRELIRFLQEARAQIRRLAVEIQGHDEDADRDQDRQDDLDESEGARAATEAEAEARPARGTPGFRTRAHGRPPPGRGPATPERGSSLTTWARRWTTGGSWWRTITSTSVRLPRAPVPVWSSRGASASCHVQSSKGGANDSGPVDSTERRPICNSARREVARFSAWRLSFWRCT